MKNKITLHKESEYNCIANIHGHISNEHDCDFYFKSEYYIHSNLILNIRVSCDKDGIYMFNKKNLNISIYDLFNLLSNDFYDLYQLSFQGLHL